MLFRSWQKKAQESDAKVEHKDKIIKHYVSKIEVFSKEITELFNQFNPQGRELLSQFCPELVKARIQPGAKDKQILYYQETFKTISKELSNMFRNLKADFRESISKKYPTLTKQLKGENKPPEGDKDKQIKFYQETFKTMHKEIIAFHKGLDNDSKTFIKKAVPTLMLEQLTPPVQQKNKIGRAHV